MQGSLFIAGYDRNPLVYQKCVKKLQNHQFDEDKYQFAEDEADQEEADEQELKEENVDEVVIDDNPEYIIDERCKCEFCEQFNKQYVHELDLFSPLIWVLGLHKAQESAEFKAIYVFGARTMEEGLFEGTCIC